MASLKVWSGGGGGAGRPSGGITATISKISLDEGRNTVCPHEYTLFIPNGSIRSVRRWLFWGALEQRLWEICLNRTIKAQCHLEALKESVLVWKPRWTNICIWKQAKVLCRNPNVIRERDKRRQS